MSSVQLPFNATFVQKIWHMVESGHDEQATDGKPLIHWNSDGNSFIIREVDGFSKKLLPRYFKHSNYSSFVRQLNMYGFHKNKAQILLNEFAHRHFRRGHREALNQIKRKALQQTMLIERTPQLRKKSVSAFEQREASDTDRQRQTFEELQRINQQLTQSLQRQRSQRENILHKTRKFLSSLSAQIVRLELDLQKKGLRPHTASPERISVDLLNQLTNHLTNASEQPFNYQIYQRFVGCLLYLLPMKSISSLHRPTIILSRTHIPQAP